MMRTISFEEEFVVVKPYEEEILKKDDEPITMNVGIKDLLSILIEFEHINYSIHGTLKGFVTFGKVNLLLTKMEVQLLKKETIFMDAASKKAKPKIVATFELIDGGPNKNETIPFRFFLEPYNLTPSYPDVSGNFSVRYYLNLIMKDQKNNKYFKQKEIFLYRLYLKNNKNKYNTLNSNLNDAEQLKDFITEPIDYGDYFSVFNDIDDERENSKDKRDMEPDDFYFRSSLTGYIKDIEDSYDKKNSIEDSNAQIKYRMFRNNRSNTSNNFGIKKINIPEFTDKIISTDIKNDNKNKKKNKEKKDKKSNKDNNDNKISNKDIINEINNSKKSNSVSNKDNNNKNKEKKNQVINIKEKNKYKNNDIFINDNYYNTDNYIIYQNSYQNVFDDKLKQNRIKTNLSEKNKINDEEDEKQINNDDNDKNKNSSLINSINDYNLYYPNEPFSNTLIMSNFPSNYNNIGQSGDFRQNLMGSRIKKKK